MHRSAPRLGRILACAAVPVMLVAGCSSGSDKDSEKNGDNASKSASASPSVAAAKFAKLPDVCKTLSEKSVGTLVPKAETKKGKTLPSADLNESSSCLWTGLDGFKYRSLTVSLRLFENNPSLGSGAERAVDYLAQQTDKATTADGAKKPKTGKATGIGEASNTVRTESKKDGVDFRNQTVVARSGNVVVTVEYDGAGYEDEKTPDAGKLLKDAEGAAKDVVAAVTKANA